MATKKKTTPSAETTETVLAEAPPKAKGEKKATRKSGAKGPGRKTAGRAPRGESSIKEVDTKGKNLIIVESPAKARTIEKYLGSDFKVAASLGHVVDLPSSGLAVDVKNDFKPEYQVIKGKESVMNALKRMAKSADAVYLAPDPDREGEAIAYHIAQAIHGVQKHVYRATFNEITKNAVRHSIDNPRQIDVKLFNAQQARRILDRLVGYPLSQLLWKKVQFGLSAGRVQSVAVRLVVEREREIKAFTPEEYWTIEGQASAKTPPPFLIRLARIDDKKAEIPNQQASDAVLDGVRGKPFVVDDVIKKEVAKRPFPPFITSTLQQEASRRLRMTAKRTMALAQGLYEGVELGDLGTVGLITYMRTDSTRLSNEAVTQIRKEIGDDYGPNYLPESPRVFASRKGAQDAHEAIRPTDITLIPERIARFLDKDQLALYTLIWKRSMACQMADARVERTRVEIPVGRYQFVATGSTVVFDGFMRIYQEAQDESGKTESDVVDGSEKAVLEDDAILPQLEKGQELQVKDLKGSQHFTQPPPRFTEAGLIRELEKQGIGRPSTYAAITSTIQERKYATKDNGTFRPTDLGNTITDLLKESFPKIMDVQFTAKMENQLDEVEEGSVDWVELLRGFYEPFAENLKTAQVEMRNIKAESIPTDFTCEKCGKPMVIKWGRNGKFLACSGYPDCRSTKPIVEVDGEVKIQEEEKTDKVCPNCGRPMTIKKSWRGGRFLACTGYPECKTAMPIPTGVPCPRPGCTGELVERQSPKGRFYSCNKYPECRYSLNELPRKEKIEGTDKEFFFIGQGEKMRSINPEAAEFGYAVYTPSERKGRGKSKAKETEE